MTNLTIKKYRFYLYFLLFFLQNTSSFLWANPKADSLLQVLSSAKESRQQYELNIQVAQAIKYESLKTALKHLQAAQNIAQQQHWINEQGQILLELYSCYRLMPEQDSTTMLQTLEQAQHFFQESNDDTRYLEAVGYLASYHFSEERTILARQLIQDGLRYAAQKKSSVGRGILLINLSKILINQDSLDACRVVCKEGLTLLKNTTFYNYIGIAYNNIGVASDTQTKIYEGVENFEQAQTYFSKTNNQPALLSVLLNIGNVYQSLRDYNAAEKRYLFLLQQCEDAQYLKGIYKCKSRLAVLYMYKTEYETAYLWFKGIAPDYDKYFKGEDHVFFLTNFLKSALRSGHLSEARTIYAALEEKLKTFPTQLHKNEIEIARGEYFFTIGSPQKAYTYIKQGIELSLKQKDNIEAQTGYKLLVKICLALNRKDEAEQAFADYQRIDQLILNEDNLSRTQFYKNKQEQDAQNIEHEKEIATLQLKAATDQKQKRMWTWFGVITLLGVGAYIVNLYGRYREKTESNLLLNQANERNEALLLNILPSEVANELKANGKTEAKEIASATVLFSDIQNFTQMSERMNATDLVAELDYCFSAFDAIVARYPVEKIKTVGDAYICAGGLPNANTTHPLDIARVAIDFQVFMQRYKQQRELEKRPFFEMRIGIHTGSLVAGVVGTTKFVYDIWGDTVNTAARLEQNGKVGKINLSEETYQRIQSTYACTYRGKYEVKHKGAIAMYFLEF
ncbi:MAG: hypothetical protein RLZZ292_3909 [Bacteroidota bacterium]|jgi:class 3 adenylate cyclase